MAWIELHQSLFTHRKTMQAAETLDLPEVYVVAHLAALWTWALDNAPDGVLPASRRIIGKAAQWSGDPTALVNALFDAGFLDGDEEGRTLIHDWHSYAGRLVAVRQNETLRDVWDRLRPVIAPLVYEKHGSFCEVCGSKDDLTIDHIMPLSKRGSNHMDNLIPLCRKCNSRKGNHCKGTE